MIRPTVVLALLGVALSSSVSLDAAVARIWAALYAFGPTHWQMAEAMVATLGFWVAGSFFECLHLLCPSVLKHRLDGDGISGDSRSPRSSAPADARKPKVITSAWFFLQTKVGGSAVYLAAIALFHTAVRTKPPLVMAPPSAIQLVLEVWSGLVGYDLLFTPVHWALHGNRSVHESGSRVPRGARRCRQGSDGAESGPTEKTCQVVPRPCQGASQEVCQGAEPPARGQLEQQLGFAAVFALNPLAWLVTRPALGRAVAQAFAGPAHFECPPAREGHKLCEPEPPWLVRRPRLRRLVRAAWNRVLSGLAQARRGAGHGVHHEMRGALQAGATVHHSLADGAAQVLVNILVQNQVHLRLVAWPLARLGMPCWWAAPALWALPALALLPLATQPPKQPCGQPRGAPAPGPGLGRAPHPSPPGSSPRARVECSEATRSASWRGWVGYWAVFGGLVALGWAGGLAAPRGWDALGPRHPLSRFVHNVAVTWLLCESHSGYDLWWMSHRLAPRVFGGSARHNLHHNAGDANFQQFFTYMDDSHGTGRDWPAPRRQGESRTKEGGGANKAAPLARPTRGAPAFHPPYVWS